MADVLPKNCKSDRLWENHNFSTITTTPSSSSPSTRLTFIMSSNITTKATTPPPATISPTPTFPTSHAHPFLLHPITITLRCLLASILALIFAPFLAPALTQSLPTCLIVRLYERLAVKILSFVAALAAVQVVMRPRTQLPSIPTHSYLPPPLVRVWASPLPNRRAVTTYDQPGRWMNDEQLLQLLDALDSIAESSIGQVPSHRLFDRQNIRAVLTNRVVCVVSDEQGPMGFTAMAYLDVPGHVVVHLGLTMIGKRGRGQRIQSTLFTKTLLMAVVNLSKLSYYITNVAASPAGIGNVCDYFSECYPSYQATERREHHIRIARHVLGMYRYEFGCSEKATFDEHCFVVYGSNEKDGGGTHQFIKGDGAPVSRHRLETCNKFVASLIDFSAGDEMFQVATFSFLISLVKYVLSPKHRRRTRNEGRRNT